MSAAPRMLRGALAFPTVVTILATLESEGIAEIDLAEVSHIDSAGLSLLLELARRARRSGRVLTIHRAPPQVRELAAFFGVSQMLGLGAAADLPASR